MRSEVELTPVTRPCGLYRQYIKGELKKILLSEDILVEILIDWHGHSTFVKKTWHKYWEPLTQLLSPVGLNILENLRKTRRQYILERFSRSSTGITESIRHRYFVFVIKNLNNFCLERKYGRTHYKK